MRHSIVIFLACFTLLVTSQQAFSQTFQHLGIGYHTEAFQGHGLRVEWEIERFSDNALSLPIRTSAGYFFRSSYHAFFLSEHIGFRQQLAAGWFVEQGISLGLIAKAYTTDEIYFEDRYGNFVFPGDGPVLGFMPGVDAALGYGWQSANSRTNRIWVRPEITWDLGQRSFYFPFFNLQVGFSHSIR